MPPIEPHAALPRRDEQGLGGGVEAIMMVAQGHATARYTELTGQARRFIIRVMNAVAKRGVNRFSRGTATKPATIMPAMNTSKDRWRRSCTASENVRWRMAASSKYSRPSARSADENRVALGVEDARLELRVLISESWYYASRRNRNASGYA